jgi:toxin ParE1/3/4
VRYFFAEAARAEHLEQVSYYEEQRAGLGARYLAAFRTAIARACDKPDRFPIEHAGGIRRIRIPGFPFSMLYRVLDLEVEVLAIAAHRRRPGYWTGRL